MPGRCPVICDTLCIVKNKPLAQEPDPTITHWPVDRPVPDERALRAILSSQNMAPFAWGNPPHDHFAEHAHGYHKVLYCLNGSIDFLVPEFDAVYTLRPGDRLDLPAHLRHSARVGPIGVVCLEAHRNAIIR